MLSFVLRRLKRKDIWMRIFVERLSEPVHLNLIALFVAAFGSVRAKIAFDIYARQQHAFGLLNAADRAIDAGISRATVIEFGVANGAGLLNICRLAEIVTKATGVTFDIYGFDTGQGMPPARDYRDQPNLYSAGDFPMQRPDALIKALPPNAHLIIGDIADTLPAFISRHSPESPIGFVSIDVDYYSTTVEVLKLFDADPSLYFPLVALHVDDVLQQQNCDWAGERLAIAEFNATHELRKIGPSNNLRSSRVFKNARWIDQSYALHVFDDPWRSGHRMRTGQQVLRNPDL